jgi:hypothetical protein
MRIPHGCRAADGPAWTRTRDRLAGESGGSKLSSGLSVAKRADEPTCLGAVEHDGRRLAVAEGAELDERGLSGDAYVRAMPVGAEDKRWAELRGERGEGAAGLRTFIECARVVAEEDVDLAGASDALVGCPLERGGPIPAAGGSRRPDAKRAAVGEAPQAAEPEARSARQVVQAEPSGTGPGVGLRAWASASASAWSWFPSTSRSSRPARRRRRRRSGGSGAVPGRAAGF